jgi:hypothetical protein
MLFQFNRNIYASVLLFFQLMQQAASGGGNTMGNSFNMGNLGSKYFVSTCTLLVKAVVAACHVIFFYFFFFNKLKSARLRTNVRQAELSDIYSLFCVFLIC